MKSKFDFSVDRKFNNMSFSVKDADCVLRAPEKKFLDGVVHSKRLSLFEMLNPNSKGVISKYTVIGAKIDPEDFAVVKRIVEELIELNEEINFEEFCKALDLLEQRDNSLQDKNFEVPDENQEANLPKKSAFK